ncbi:transcriptional regulator, partial [Pseudomonas syringae]
MAELEKLTSDEGLKREIEVETKLRDRLAEYNLSLKNIITPLDPQSAPRGIQRQPEQKPKQTRR